MKNSESHSHAVLTCVRTGLLRNFRIRASLVCMGLPLAFLGGCKRFHAKPSDQYVYVTAKQAFLRDRVAAVSNRTGQVNNGERLKVLEHGRHSIRVQDTRGETGWIEEKMVATDEVVDDFDQLKDQHKDDAQIASGVVRDLVYMHIKPGRDAEHFFLLNEGDKLKLLRRASVEKSTTGAAAAKAQKAIPQAAGTNAKKDVAEPVKTAGAGSAGAASGGAKPDAAAAPAPVMEDWWLVRDGGGHTGWVYARMVDVDAPDTLTRYAENQRFVGAYVLTTVHDDGAPGDQKDIPIYVTVLSPYKAGLPYDFDQIRVFTWSLARHRYENGFRLKNIEGFLPVVLGKVKDPGERPPLGQEALPAFTFRMLTADAGPIALDPATGEVRPGKTIAQTFRIEGNQVHRVGPVVEADAVAHPEPEEEKKKGRKR